MRSASSWWRHCSSAYPGLRRKPPEKWELAEGTLTLAALAMVSVLAFGCPTHYWYTVLPLGLLLPVLLAAHCRPVFAAAAVLILGFSVVLTTTFGMGDLAELPSLHDRAYAAQSDACWHSQPVRSCLPPCSPKGGGTRRH